MPDVFIYSGFLVGSISVFDEDYLHGYVMLLSRNSVLDRCDEKVFRIELSDENEETRANLSFEQKKKI